MELCTRLTALTPREGGALIRTDGADLLLIFLTDEIVRLRVSFDRRFPEASYVLALTAWEDRLDPLFAGERERLRPVEPAREETDRGYVFRTAALRLELDREPLGLRLYDAQGRLLHESLAGLPFTRDRGGRVCHYSRMEEDDCFYGFGEQTGPLNKNKCLVRERAADAMGYDPARTDTLYKHIPFAIRLSRRSKQAVGLFYHNFYESEFDLGREKSNYWPRYSRWRADGGDIDLFLLGGGSIRRVLDNYTRLTGRPALLPKRALGYQGSSMYYAELEKDSDRAVLDFVDTVREKDFPLDGFHLSSGYTSLDGKRCVFTWNRERFPDPAGFFAAMAERGAPVAPNVKPGLLCVHPLYRELAEAGVFVRDSREPDRPAAARWWGGPGALWDFTDPGARQRWKALLREHLLEQGAASLWNDNCEYDAIPDLDARVSFDGAGGTLAELKPVMANLMCRLGAEAIREQRPGLRPYIVCRAGCAGIQRYAQTWCGDNRTSWDSLRWGIPLIAGLGLSGQPNQGADIGGFAGPAPDEELFVRWVQHGIFQPRFSIHSASSDNTVTEPWMFRRSTALIREAIRLRYRLSPYFYSLAYEASRTGAPILRPPVYEFQDDERVYDESFTFLLGPCLLVANVLEPGASSREVYLPGGCRWYYWDEALTCYAGGQTVSVPVDRASIPLFIREGAILPLADDPPRCLERDKVRRLRLLIAPGGESEALLYDDDGVSEAWRGGVWRQTLVRVSGSEQVRVSFHAEGSYPDPVEQLTVELICKARSPYWVALGDERLPHFLDRTRFEAAARGWYYSQTARAVLVKTPQPRRDVTLTVSFEDFDLIGM